MSILFAILLFSFLIFIHELGHFVAAKLSGVQVNEFALFMGPALVKWQKGETLYSIRCIPIGGYCAMEGEDEDTDNPRSFQKAAWWKRLIILVAGSFMNFVAGILLFAIVVSPAQTLVEPVIASHEPYCTIVSEEGFHVGDRILEVDGDKVFVRSDFSLLLSLGKDDVYDFLVERDGKKVEIKDLYMEKHEVIDEDGSTAYMYGISFSTVEATFGAKASYAWNLTLDSVRNVWLSLRMIFSGQAGFNDVGGPVQIVKIMSDTAAASETTQMALLNMVNIGAVIAINLAVMNMLPIPALDGGRTLSLLLTTVIEKISGKKLDPKYEGYVHGVGMVLLLILMAVIFLKDIIMLF